MKIHFLNILKHKKILFILYLLLLHVFIIITMLKSNIVEVVSLKLGWAPHQITNFYKTMLSFHLRGDGNVPNQSIIIIGDSIIQGLCAPCLSHNVINYGIGGDTTLGVIHRIKKYKSLDNAKIIMLAIGHNDLVRRDDNDIIANFKIIISLLDKKNLVISLILPVDERVINNKNILNGRIRNLNIKISDLCSRYRRCVTFDLGTKLVGNDSNLMRNFHIGDGIHLNTSGYSIFINNTRELVKSMENINE